MKPKETINLIDTMIEWNKKCEAPGGDKSKILNKEVMIGNALFFYAAGTDTSRATSTSLLYCLSEFKEARDLVYNDITENLLEGKLEEFLENPQMEIDWDKGKEIDQFLNETMRLWGIGNNAIYRICTKSHKMNGIKIKKGTRASFSICSIHRDSEYWKNPDKFDISRFSKENMRKMLKRTFMPFYEGNRQCSGMYLGQVMTKCVLLSILTQYEVERDPNFDPNWLWTMTLEMPSVKLRLRPRKR